MSSVMRDAVSESREQREVALPFLSFGLRTSGVLTDHLPTMVELLSVLHRGTLLRNFEIRSFLGYR